MIIDRPEPANQQGFIGGFYIRPMELVLGQVHQGHAHWIDHVSNIIKPPLRILMWNPTTGEHVINEVLIPCKINIKAEWWHRFTALSKEGCAWECWFSKAEAEAKYDYPVLWNQELPLNKEMEEEFDRFFASLMGTVNG